MSERYQVKVIARMHSLFPTKFGIPRQSGLVEQLHSLVVFEPEYRDPQALLLSVPVVPTTRTRSTTFWHSQVSSVVLWMFMQPRSTKR